MQRSISRSSSLTAVLAFALLGGAGYGQATTPPPAQPAPASGNPVDPTAPTAANNPAGSSTMTKDELKQEHKQQKRNEQAASSKAKAAKSDAKASKAESKAAKADQKATKANDKAARAQEKAGYSTTTPSATNPPPPSVNPH